MVSFKPMKAMHRHEALIKELRHETKSLRKSVRELVLLEQLAGQLPDLLIIMMLTGVAYVAVSILHLDLSSMLVSGFLILGLTRSVVKVHKSVRESTTAEVGYWSFMDTLRETEAAAETFKGASHAQPEDGLPDRERDVLYGRAPVLKNVSMELAAGTITTLVGGIRIRKDDNGGSDPRSLRAAAGPRDLGRHPHAAKSIWASGAARSAMSRRKSCCSTTPSLPTSPWAIQRSAKPPLSRRWKRPAPCGLSRNCRKACSRRLEIAASCYRVASGSASHLARALITEPALLILDEATSAWIRKPRRKSARPLPTQRGKLTVLAITHQPAWVELADQVYRIDQGTVVDNDSATEMNVTAPASAGAAHNRPSGGRLQPQAPSLLFRRGFRRPRPPHPPTELDG